jgi:predicted transcriptional regulator
MTIEKRLVPVARLGVLERAVMETLWDLTGPTTGERDTTARRVVDRLAVSRSLAYTTVLTVLERLERKGLVRRLREGRPYRYAPAATREAYAAELMLEALGRASDRHAALVRFVDAVSPKEAEVLRRALLGDAERREAPP